MGAGWRQRLARCPEHTFNSAFKIPHSEFETAHRKTRVWGMARIPALKRIQTEARQGRKIIAQGKQRAALG
jgi:hypothetical protein